MLSIPLPTRNEPKATYAVQLDGQTFDLGFVWSERTDTWTMSISASDGTGLAAGILLTPGVNLLRTVTADERPGGALVLTNFGDAIPTLTGIETSTLYYVTAEELEE